ncbi:F-box only protein 7 isoform 2-T3 [Aulostomus maculatus]
MTDDLHSMKLRVRINKQTRRVELLGEDPSLLELMDRVRDAVLPSAGLSGDTQFSLSLNGAELLCDTRQTLSSCGVVSGDLVCVILPESVAAASSTASSRVSSSTENQSMRETTTSSQPASGPPPLTVSQDNSSISASSSSVPIWEPMLCSEAQEGEAPLSLELVYHAARPTSPSDALVVAGHLLMLETGFSAQGCESKPGEMPAGWRSVGGVYKLQYCHPLCEGSVTMVVITCMGPLLVMNATLKVNESINTVGKLSVKPASYVTEAWPGESAAAAFKDLSKLSRLFKDQLAYPLIAAAREAMSLPMAFGLAVLPLELLLRVLRLLDVRSVVRLSAVCKHFHACTADSSLWRHLFHRDFSDPEPRPRDTDWRELYKRFHREFSDRRRVPWLSSLPHFPQHPIFIPQPLPSFPVPPGIIGGEYDQRPHFPLLPRRLYDPIGPPPGHHR